jgi:glycosyltransferase involved in cell wall biosynthesis
MPVSFLPAPFASSCNKTLYHWVCEGIDAATAQYIRKHAPGFVYAYEDAASLSFQAGKDIGARCIYDLPIPYHAWKANILAQQREAFPEYFSQSESDFETAIVTRKKEKELALADHIIVASKASEQSLLAQHVASNRIHRIPYGVDLEYFHTSEAPRDEIFRVLFVGRIGIRKGVHYLLRAWKKLALPKAELLLVGYGEAPKRLLQDILSTPNVRILPPQSRQELVRIYQQSHVLAFPSLIEGFGMVILEALACGTPVITTEATCGPDCIEEGRSGWIIPCQELESALCERLAFLYQNPPLWYALRENARLAAQGFSWVQYEERLATTLRYICSS